MTGVCYNSILQIQFFPAKPNGLFANYSLLNKYICAETLGYIPRDEYISDILPYIWIIDVNVIGKVSP